jgi:hypothetical protein
MDRRRDRGETMKEKIKAVKSTIAGNALERLIVAENRARALHEADVKSGQFGMDSLRRWIEATARREGYEQAMADIFGTLATVVE